jgi:hypothetical protein
MFVISKEVNLTLEAETTITPRPFLYREYYRKRVAGRIEILRTHSHQTFRNNDTEFDQKKTQAQ